MGQRVLRVLQWGWVFAFSAVAVWHVVVVSSPPAGPAGEIRILVLLAYLIVSFPISYAAYIGLLPLWLLLQEGLPSVNDGPIGDVITMAVFATSGWLQWFRLVPAAVAELRHRGRTTTLGLRDRQ